MPGLARGLKNLKKGERRQILLSAEEAYGFYDPDKVIIIPRRLLPKGPLTLGMSVSVANQQGEVRSYRVLQVLKDSVQLDGNHPLAGQDLAFEIEALDVREATPAELEDAVPDGDRPKLH